MNRKILMNTVFSLFPVIGSQLAMTRTPDNLNLFQFPSKVRVIGSRLYHFFVVVIIVKMLRLWMLFSHCLLIGAMT